MKESKHWILVPRPSTRDVNQDLWEDEQEFGEARRAKARESVEHQEGIRRNK